MRNSPGLSIIAAVAGVGTITANDDTTWIVPASTAFQTGPRAADLYNECGGTMLASSAEIDLEAIPITEIDPAGDVITAYIFADNYFELYVAGRLVAVDPVPFTPFNSNVVRFRAQRPFSVAVLLVDWEENLGLGSEQGRGSPYHPGDGGLVARGLAQHRARSSASAAALRRLRRARAPARGAPGAAGNARRAARHVCAS